MMESSVAYKKTVPFVAKRYCTNLLNFFPFVANIRKLFNIQKVNFMSADFYEDKILKFITTEDLNENLQYYADLIGLENLKKLMMYAGGGHIYIPQPDTFKTIALEKYLKANKDSIDFNCYHKISQDFGICTKVVGQVFNRVTNRIVRRGRQIKKLSSV